MVLHAGTNHLPVLPPCAVIAVLQGTKVNLSRTLREHTARANRSDECMAANRGLLINWLTTTLGKKRKGHAGTKYWTDCLIG